ncbi:GspH/FimT family pseudopilin [Stutzerimonas stutzeri]|uniref:GspH/FimT family pseudopilin n=1 Tax=Stutzerimonas stutzeri TaxID=316 RepID=UPI00066B900B|nr:prepilin-type N-terminal cleavage/methylation domain-containing protein [Stutzerimonas stutzeri]
MLTSKGLSLAELLVTLSMISILSMIAVPGMGRLRQDQELSNSLSALRGALAYARQEAIRTGGSVSITPKQRRWQNGWRVFLDSNHDGILQAQERVLRDAAPVGNGLSLTGNTPVQSYIRYTPSGRATLINGAYQMGTLALCQNDGSRGYKLRLNNAGRVSVVAVDECEAF